MERDSAVSTPGRGVTEGREPRPQRANWGVGYQGPDRESCRRAGSEQREDGGEGVPTAQHPGGRR